MGIKPDNEIKVSACSCDSMCNGVFNPVCEPMVCEIPRMPQYQDLVLGNGTFVQEIDSNNQLLSFEIHIYRMQHAVLGELLIKNHTTREIIATKRLESYHAPTVQKFIAVFHQSLVNEESRELAVYGMIGMGNTKPAFYVYSAPFVEDEVRIGGNLQSGNILIQADAMEMEH